MLPSGVKSNAPTCGSRARRVCTGRVLRCPLDGWPSGLRRTPGKRVCVKAYREFESHSIRCPVNDLRRWRDGCFWPQRTDSCGLVVDWLWIGARSQPPVAPRDQRPGGPARRDSAAAIRWSPARCPSRGRGPPPSARPTPILFPVRQADGVWVSQRSTARWTRYA